MKYQKSRPRATIPGPDGRRSRSDDHEETAQLNGGSGRVALKEGKITGGEKFLLAVARGVGGKWEEVGIALEVEYNALMSTVTSRPAGPEHMRAFDMLRKWREQVAEGFTYRNLASALESASLKTCSREHCYTSSEEGPSSSK